MSTRKRLTGGPEEQPALAPDNTQRMSVGDMAPLTCFRSPTSIWGSTATGQLSAEKLATVDERFRPLDPRGAHDRVGDGGMACVAVGRRALGHDYDHAVDVDDVRLMPPRGPAA